MVPGTLLGQQQVEPRECLHFSDKCVHQLALTSQVLILVSADGV